MSNPAITSNVTKVGAPTDVSRNTIPVIARALSVIISNIPLALIALPAAYGAASFSQKYYPEPWYIILGGAFESTYLGAMFFARKKNIRVFIFTVAVAALCGVVYNWLNVAQIDGLLADWNIGGRWFLAFIHGAPLSLLGLAYAALMHFTADSEETHKAGVDVEALLANEAAYKEREEFYLGQVERSKALVTDMSVKYSERLDEFQKKINEREEHIARLEQAVQDNSGTIAQIYEQQEQELGELKDKLQQAHRENLLLRAELDGRAQEQPSNIVTLNVPVNVDYLSRFKENKDIDTLVVAHNQGGVKIDTLKMWVRRYASGVLNWSEVAEALRSSREVSIR